MLDQYRIHTLIPDLPSFSEIRPFLEEMDTNRWYSNFGPFVKRFEAELPVALPVADGAGPFEFDVVTLSSATAGLELAIRAMKLPVDSKVLVPALTFPATALAVINAGLKPVFCDVEAGSWCLTPEIAAHAVMADPAIRLVLPVTTFGRPVDTMAWRSFKQESGAEVLLDAAASLGQQKICPDVPIVFSLHATKPMGVGEGGVLVTSDRKLATHVRELTNFGFDSKGSGLIGAAGTNAKMGEYFAAVGLAQLGRYDEVMARRQRVLTTYVSLFQDKGILDAIELQSGLPQFVPAVFCVGIKGRVKHVKEAFDASAIQWRTWYIPPLHMQPAFADISVIGTGKMRTQMPVVDSATESLIGLPFHSFLTEDHINEIIDCMIEGIIE